MTEDQPKPELRLTGNAKLLKTVFQLHSKMATEEKLVFNGSSIDTRIVDPAHVAMIVQKIPINALDEYHNNQENLELGVKPEKIVSLFTGSLKNSDNITLEYDPVSDTLISQFRYFNRKTGLIDTNGMPDPKTPNLDLPGKGVFESKSLFDFLKQADKISDHIAVIFTPQGAYFVSKGDQDTIKIFFPSEDIPEYVCHKPLCSLFSVDYFYNILYHLKNIHPMITLFINNDNPIRIYGNDLVETEALIAPRLETDTDTDYREYINDTPKPTNDQEPEETTVPGTETTTCDDCPETLDCDHQYEDCQQNPANQDDDINEPDHDDQEPTEPQQPEPNPIPQIKPSGPIVKNHDGTYTQMYTDEELEIAAKLQEQYQKRHQDHIFKRCLRRLRERDMEKTTREPDLQKDIDLNIILDVLEDYDYTWNHETIGGC